ncbi:MAG TPA: nitroreductase family deazaflavin-dependent oxidoreductase [Acidimicrobiales bacterium]|nr:nitroreductase family deazaflavin-dependent oxidoreductase [Acidimicrobiales bacterium]
MPVRGDYSDSLLYNAATTEEFRANKGQVTGDFAGRTILLLTTTGAKTGLLRVTPLIYTKDGDSFVVTAADAGSDHHPGWYYNILANPVVTVEVADKTYEAIATEPIGVERDRLYANRIVETPRFAEYQAKTTRQIPIILLTPDT